MSLKQNENFYEHQHENAKEKVLRKHQAGTKGPQKASQAFGQMAKGLAQASGKMDTYRVERSKMKHELKKI